MIEEEEYPVPPPPLELKIYSSCNEEKMVEEFRKYSKKEERTNLYKNICSNCDNIGSRQNKYYCTCCRMEITMKNKTNHNKTKKHKENEWKYQTINN